MDIVHVQASMANEKHAQSWKQLVIVLQFLILMHRIIFLQFTVVRGIISGVRS